MKNILKYSAVIAIMLSFNYTRATFIAKLSAEGKALEEFSKLSRTEQREIVKSLRKEIDSIDREIGYIEQANKSLGQEREALIIQSGQLFNAGVKYNDDRARKVQSDIEKIMERVQQNNAKISEYNNNNRKLLSEKIKKRNDIISKPKKKV